MGAGCQLTKRLYQRYVKYGAPFPWAENFGRDCPEPDFSAIQETVKKQ